MTDVSDLLKRLEVSRAVRLEEGASHALFRQLKLDSSHQVWIGSVWEVRKGQMPVCEDRVTVTLTQVTGASYLVEAWSNKHAWMEIGTFTHETLNALQERMGIAEIIRKVASVCFARSFSFLDPLPEGYFSEGEAIP